MLMSDVIMSSFLFLVNVKIYDAGGYCFSNFYDAKSNVVPVSSLVAWASRGEKQLSQVNA